MSDVGSFWKCSWLVQFESCYDGDKLMTLQPGQLQAGQCQGERARLIPVLSKSLRSWSSNLLSISVADHFVSDENSPVILIILKNNGIPFVGSLHPVKRARSDCYLSSFLLQKFHETWVFFASIMDRSHMSEGKQGKVEAQITAPLFMGIWYMNLSLETSREFLMLLTCVSALIIVEETSHNEPQRPYCRKLEVGEISFTRNVWYRMIHQEYHQGCTEFLYRPLVRNIFASQKLKVYIDVKPPAKPKYLVQNALLWVVPLQFLQFF